VPVSRRDDWGHRVTASRDVLLNMALSLHTAFVSAWMPPFRLHPYLPTAVLGVAKHPMPAGPKWPKQFGQADAGAVENGGALA